MSVPNRKRWKQDLKAYLQIDERRSRGQIASVVVPYLSVWVVAALVRPGPWVAVALGLVATVFLVRMYSLFHDLTHNALFRSRAANRRWGTVLGYLLFTPYRWWQRQHALHHANTGNLDNRGPGEIYTMTVGEYARASRRKRFGYRLYRNPLLMMLVGPSLVFVFERRFPQRGMTRTIFAGVIATNVALTGWVAGWSLLVGWGTFALIQGTTLVAGGAVAAWMLYIQHQYEDTYYMSGGDWQFELAALQGSSYLHLPRALAWAVGNANFHHVHHLSAKIPNYNLRAAHTEQPLFANTPVVTIRSSVAALRLKLWDEDAGALVRFPARQVRSSIRRREHSAQSGHDPSAGRAVLAPGRAAPGRAPARALRADRDAAGRDDSLVAGRAA